MKHTVVSDRKSTTVQADRLDIRVLSLSLSFSPNYRTSRFRISRINVSEKIDGCDRTNYDRNKTVAKMKDIKMYSFTIGLLSLQKG